MDSAPQLLCAERPARHDAPVDAQPQAWKAAVLRVRRRDGGERGQARRGRLRSVRPPGGLFDVVLDELVVHLEKLSLGRAWREVVGSILVRVQQVRPQVVFGPLPGCFALPLEESMHVVVSGHIANGPGGYGWTAVRRCSAAAAIRCTQ